jgi:hypothetical protein
MIVLRCILITGGIALAAASIYNANVNAGGYYIINGIPLFAGVVMFFAGLVCWLLTPPKETVCKFKGGNYERQE